MNQKHPLAQIILPTQKVRFPITLLSPAGEQIGKWTYLMTYIKTFIELSGMVL